MSNQITLTFPDNTSRQFSKGTTLMDVAEGIGSRLAQDAVAGKINGRITDLTESIKSDAEIVIVTGDTP